jgi:hypothetical protein
MGMMVVEDRVAGEDTHQVKAGRGPVEEFVERRV